jgi:hypothetical protein
MSLIYPETVEKIRERVQPIIESTDPDNTEEIDNSVKCAAEDFAASMGAFEGLDWCCVTSMNIEVHAHSSSAAYLRSVAERSTEMQKRLLKSRISGVLWASSIGQNTWAVNPLSNRIAERPQVEVMQFANSSFSTCSWT